MNFKFYMHDFAPYFSAWQYEIKFKMLVACVRNSQFNFFYIWGGGRFEDLSGNTLFSI